MNGCCLTEAVSIDEEDAMHAVPVGLRGCPVHELVRVIYAKIALEIALVIAFLASPFCWR